MLSEAPSLLASWGAGGRDREASVLRINPWSAGGSHNAALSMFPGRAPQACLAHTDPPAHSPFPRAPFYLCVCCYAASADLFVQFHWCAHIH